MQPVKAHRPRGPAILGVLEIFALGVVPFGISVACTTPECTSLYSCGEGMICSPQQTCVEDPSTPHPGRDAGVGGTEGEGEGEGDPRPAVEEVELRDPVTMLAPNPQASGSALLAMQGDSIGDVVTTFTFATKSASSTPLYDFGAAGNACGVDSIVALPTSVTATGGGFTFTRETWFSCNTPRKTVLSYDVDDDALPALSPGGGANSEADAPRPIVAVLDTPADPLAQHRIIYAERGDKTLTIDQVRAEDIPLEPRFAQDTIDAGVTFRAIMSVHVLLADDAQDGDIILIHDRGGPATNELPLAPPRFVALQRLRNTSEWLPTSGTLVQELLLPSDTAVALFLDDVGITDPTRVERKDAALQAQPNIVIFRPTDGRVSFWRYEWEQTEPGSSGFLDLTLPRQHPLPTDLPAPAAPLLVVQRGSGVNRTFFYALPNFSAAWRIPFHGARTDQLSDDVLTGLMESASWRPLMMVAESDSRVWMAFSDSASTAMLRRIPFSASF